MEHIVDTVIVGAGPAGLSCGIELQKHGISNLILEKRSFPRNKTCAGGVTNKTYRLLSELLEKTDEELSPAFCDESSTLEFYYGNTRLTRSTLTKPFRFVKRSVFDHFLATEYQTRGGLLLENTTCKSIDLKSATMTLSNGDSIRFEHLVIADGALSPTAKMLGCRSPELAFCVETRVPKAKLPERDAVAVHFGIVGRGYVWVFPSGEELCIGLGGLQTKSTRYDQLLKELLISFGLDPKDYSTQGAFLPYGKSVKQHRAPNLILIGDAGGFVDPLYGEGLYFALDSGKKAADAIFTAPQKSRKAFLSLMTPEIKLIREGNRLQCAPLPQ